jgi:hypothetical protein
MFPTGKLFVTTLLNLTPAAIGLAGSLFYLGRPYSSWLLWFLWIFYVLACYGSLKAWWIPYCFRPEPERAARDTALMGQRIFFGRLETASGPTLCMCSFNVATAAILILLAVITSRPR